MAVDADDTGILAGLLRLGAEIVAFVRVLFLPNGSSRMPESRESVEDSWVPSDGNRAEGAAAGGDVWHRGEDLPAASGAADSLEYASPSEEALDERERECERFFGDRDWPSADVASNEWFRYHLTTAEHFGEVLEIYVDDGKEGEAEND